MDITFVFEALIVIIFGVITAIVIPFIKEKKLYNWVNIAVKAAEQIYTQTGMGEIKKDFVLNFLKSKGYKVDTESIDLMIESAVLSLKESLVIVDKTGK